MLLYISMIHDNSVQLATLLDDPVFPIPSIVFDY